MSQSSDPSASHLTKEPQNAKGTIKEPTAYGSNDLDYGNYLKIPELLQLQSCESDPPHHDELLFIIIHQTYELWFKLILHELGQTLELMRKKELLQANHFLKRVVHIFRVLVSQIHIIETMRPSDFLKFRDHLRPASGFQSMQFREIEFMAGLKNASYLKFFQNRPELLKHLERSLAQDDLRATYYQLLRKLGFSIPENTDLAHLEEHTEEREQLLQALLPIYRDPTEHHALYLLTESLIDLDEQLGMWRSHHAQVVTRIIGSKMGTGGSSGVGYLRSTLKKQCFPYLWQIRSML